MSAARDSGNRSNVTDLLTAWAGGDRQALDRLVPVIHGELYRLARRQMAGERIGHTLQPTALVNEAFLRLVELREGHWDNRSRFFALSARVMRHILVDAARARRGEKRGGSLRRVLFDERLFVVDTRTDFVALDEALSKLAAIDPRRAHVVELRFFGGLTVGETAHALQVSAETVMRDWKLAKAFLLREMKESAGK